MKDAGGVVLYVGKATDLRSRIRSYFQQRTDTRYQIAALLRRVDDIAMIVTDTEKEALLLERTLIRKHQPRYNILFRDDKSYVSVRVNLAHPFPGICRTRKRVKDGSRYFGPYTSGSACRETIDLVTRFFQLRTCGDREFANRSRPCIQYQIGRCTAPCVGLTDTAAYGRQLQQALLLLGGRANELTAHLTAQMEAAAAAERFEEAAQVRDRLRDIATTVEPQKMVQAGAVDRDYFGWAIAGKTGAVAVLVVRDETVIDRRGAMVPLGGDMPVAFLESFLLQFYLPPRVPPPEIFLPVETEAIRGVAAVLSEQRGTVVRIHRPRRGADAKLVALATTNARVLSRAGTSAEREWEELCAALQCALQLPKPPHLIECVDISTWSGKAPVGAIVAFAHGGPAKARYRHYRVRGAEVPNDYAMMAEVLSRRIARADALPLPDLLLVDGGKGQLGMACRVLQEAQVTTLPCAAIAKPRPDEETDKIYLPGRKNRVAFRRNDPLLRFLQRIRDEAHRFAISYQRKRRKKGILSPLKRGH